VIVPKTKYLNRKAIGERRLLALIYNNRISLLERSGDYAQSIGLSLDAWKLQGMEAPPKEPAERFLNYAVSLSSAGRDAEGLAFIRTVREMYGDYARYREYATATVGKMLNALMKKNDYAGSFDLLSAYESDIGNEDYGRMLRGVTVNYLQHAIGSITLQDALGRIAESRASLGKGDYETLVSLTHSREADRVCGGKAWLEAAAVLDRGLAEVTGQVDLVRQRTA